MRFKLFGLLFFVALLTGCSSSQIQKIPESAEIVKFYFSDLKVNLTLGEGAIPNDSTFATQQEVENQFKEDVIKYLKANDIYSDSIEVGVAELDVSIDYERRFNWGGKALNKPEVSHLVNVKLKDELLLSFGHNDYTTKYSYLKDAAVNFEIASFNWGAEDEPKDIDLVSKLIVEDLMKRMNK